MVRMIIDGFWGFEPRVLIEMIIAVLHGDQGVVSARAFMFIMVAVTMMNSGAILPLRTKYGQSNSSGCHTF